MKNTCAVTNPELWRKFSGKFRRRFSIVPTPEFYSEGFCENALGNGSLVLTPIVKK